MTHITRSQAKAWTLGAQLASVVLVLGAVMLGVIGLPEPSLDVAVDNTNANPLGTLPRGNAPTGNPISSLNTSASLQIDTIGLSERFSLLDNAPRPVVAVINDVPEGQQPVETPVGEGEISKRVRYIGFINDPDALHAFLRIDGKQRIVTVGGVARAGTDEFPDLTAEKITADYVVLSDGENRAQINLAARTGQSITMVEGDSIDIVAPSENGSLLTAEDEATIAALPPRQQPMARTRLERERRGLPPENERRRPNSNPVPTVRGNFNEGSSNRRNRDE